MLLYICNKKKERINTMAVELRKDIISDNPLDPVRETPYSFKELCDLIEKENFNVPVKFGGLFSEWDKDGNEILGIEVELFDNFLICVKSNGDGYFLDFGAEQMVTKDDGKEWWVSK